MKHLVKPFKSVQRKSFGLQKRDRKIRHRRPLIHNISPRNTPLGVPHTTLHFRVLIEEILSQCCYQQMNELDLVLHWLEIRR